MPDIGTYSKPKKAAQSGPGAFSVVVIGAGQAGLVTARELVRRGLVPGRDMLVLDANDKPGGAWQHRWESLSVDKAHHIADLPGLKRESPEGASAATAVADYFNDYEQTFELGVIRPVVVEDVESASDNTLVVRARMGDQLLELRTRTIVSATGTWTHPFIPWVPGKNDFLGQQLHTADFRSATDFVGKRTLVVGGGLSAVQMLLELAPLTQTLWSTRRPPQFSSFLDGKDWGQMVEADVWARIRSGKRPQSVVSATGIPPEKRYLEAVVDGVLVSRGPLRRFTDNAVVFAGDNKDYPDLAYPDSWAPYPADSTKEIDVIFWNTGFRAATSHLAGLRLRDRGGGIRMRDEVSVAADPRVFLVGYGSSASTVGAKRAGRAAARAVIDFLSRGTSN